MDRRDKAMGKRNYQAIASIREIFPEEENQPHSEISIHLSEIIACFTTAANVAEREQCFGVADRLRNDVDRLRLVKEDDRVMVVQ